MHRVDLEPAYILHSRAYRETSQILEVFTAGYGRLTLVARGSRRPKSKLRGVLNPFQSLRLSWSGRGDMQTLREAEVAGPQMETVNSAILSAFYINELLMKFLERSDPHPNLFAHYASFIASLMPGQALEPLLREFELQLLGEIGYAPNLAAEAVTHEPVRSEAEYEFIVEHGVVLCDGTSGQTIFPGSSLLAISRLDFTDQNVLRDAKTLLREVLNFHLGSRALHTRRVASAMKRTG